MTDRNPLRIENVPWKAAVITDGVSLTLATDKRASTFPDPRVSLADPATLLDRVATQLRGAATVLVAGYGADLPSRGPKRYQAADRIVSGAESAGWKTTRNGRPGLEEFGWVTLERGTMTLHLAVLAWVSQNRTPLFQLTEDPERQAIRLAEFQAVIGIPWRGTGALTGTALMRALPRDRVPLWYWQAAPRDVVGSTELRWDRQPTPAEKHLPMVYPFDIRAMYVAAAGVAELGYSAPVHVGPGLFEPTAAGYVLIRWDPANHADRPPAVPTQRIASNGTVWVVTPVAAYLIEQGHRLDILDAWLAPDREDPATRELAPGAGRILKSWSERFRDALTMGRCPEGSALRNAVKSTYARAIGIMSRPGGMVYRSDWRDTIVGKARVNMLRKLDSAYQVLGMWPLRINIDQVWYPGEAGDGPRIAAALGVGPRVGKFKAEKPITMDEYLEKFK